MNTKTMMLLGGLLSLPLATTSAQAGVVKFSQGVDLSAPTGGKLIIDVVGEGFTDGGPDGAAFSLTWDPTVLTFTGAAADNSIWDTVYIEDSHAIFGSIDYAFFSKSTAGGAGTDFGLASFTFDVIGASGAITSLNLGMDPFNSGFVLPGSVATSVTYVGAQLTTAAPVPLPIAAWSFLGGLLGMLRSQRKVTLFR